ncbi:MAG: hypothetical protein QM730_01650 [Anaerolineales bacterium]
MKSTAKQAFLLKIFFGMILAFHAGETMAHIVVDPYWESGLWGHFFPEFFYTLFPFICIVIMQWLLFSEYLPSHWIVLGLLGSLIAAIVIGFIFLELTQETYTAEIRILNGAISGFLLALPQWFIIKNKKGYLWIVANSIGLLMYPVGWKILENIQATNQFYLAIKQVIKLPLIPFSLMLGLYLFSSFYKPSSVEVKGNNSN